MPRNNSTQRRNERKDAARERDARKMWGNEQIDRLDARLGKGVGAVKERARINGS